MYYKLQITETASDKPSYDKSTFNRIEKSFPTLEDVKKFIIEQYGRVPNGRKKIYVGNSDKQQVVGFLHSFWNKGWSHNTKSWHQTDWICVTSCEETPVIIH